MLDWRAGTFDEQSIKHDNVLKTAITNTMNTSQNKNLDVARTNVSQEKGMQILGYGKSDSGFKSAGVSNALVSKKNNQGFGLGDYVE